MSLQTFQVSSGPVTLAAVASSTGQAVITFPTTGDFICDRLTGAATQAGLVVANFGGTVRISFNDGKMAWMTTTPVPFVSIVGSAGIPFEIRPETRIPKGSVLVVDFVNATAGTATVCSLVFHGNLEIL
jgi:hypothetical protein